MGGKILITGGTGLIGTNLIHQLYKRGENLKILLRKNSSTEGIDHLNVERVYGDILDKPSLEKAMVGVDRVFHIAGIVNLGPFQREMIHRVNVGGTRNVMEAAVAAGVKRVVHTSTVSTVGLRGEDCPADETTYFQHDKIQSPYFESKFEGEKVALDFHHQDKLEVVVVNPSVVIGPWDLKKSSGKTIWLSAKLGGFLFYPKGKINVVHVNDVVAGHIAAMEKGRSGERYLLGGENITQRDFINSIAEVIGLRKPIMGFGYALAFPVAVWGDFAGKLFPNTFKHFNTLLVRKLMIEQCIDCTKAKTELDLPQTPVKNAIDDAYRWFREYRGLKPFRSLFAVKVDEQFLLSGEK